VNFLAKIKPDGKFTVPQKIATVCHDSRSMDVEGQCWLLAAAGGHKLPLNQQVHVQGTDLYQQHTALATFTDEQGSADE